MGKTNPTCEDFLVQRNLLFNHFAEARSLAKAVEDLCGDSTSIRTAVRKPKVRTGAKIYEDRSRIPLGPRAPSA